MKAVLYVICFLGSFSLFGTIVPTNSLDPLKQELSSFQQDDLVIFDIDETLVVSKDLILRPCGRLCLNGLIAQYGKEYDKKKRECLVTQVMLQRKIQVIDPTSIDLVRSIQARKTKVIALTALKTGPYGSIPKMEDWRVEELARTGYDFSPAFGHIETIALTEWDGEKHQPVFIKGVLCTCKYPKGDVLAAFLKRINWTPKRVFFVDDRLHNIESVQKSMEEMHIPFIGYHYSGAEELPGILDIKLAELQLGYFLKKGVWLSDSDALPLLK